MELDSTMYGGLGKRILLRFLESRSQSDTLDWDLPQFICFVIPHLFQLERE